VLVLLANEVNQEGYGWPSVNYIADRTEISRRTVLRVIQCFGEIGLLSRAVSPRGGFAVQVNLNKLGADLADAFAEAYQRAQRHPGKVDDEECLTDTSGYVSQTGQDVSQTQRYVSQTLPPHPLLGVPVIDPVGTHPQPPQAGACCPEDEPLVCDFTEEQLAHLATHADNPSWTLQWESYYRDVNRAERENAEAQRLAEMAAAEELEKLKAELGSTPAARAWVMRGCGFVESRRGRGMGPIVEAVLAQQLGLGVQLWEAGPAMVKAWKKFSANGARIDVHWGPANFFQLGIWLDERGWAWSEARMERHAGASVGTLERKSA